MEFTVEVPEVEELGEGEPGEVVLENAVRKAAAVEGRTVLGVDTAVVLEGRIYGKPRDEGEARAFLERLAGGVHEVMSGVALRAADGERSGVCTTRVRFRGLGREEIDWYLASGEWRERAGGYAIQGRGAALVAEIAGDYSNVVGLPVSTLVALAPGLLFAGVS